MSAPTTTRHLSTYDEQHVAEAREFEAQAAATGDPAERDRCLLEAGTLWRLAGDGDRALAAFRAVSARDAPMVRFWVADTLCWLGRDGEAEHEVAALRREPSVPPAVCGLVGELLEANERFVEALDWFERGMGELDDEVRTSGRLAGGVDGALGLVHGRRRVRAALGRLPDDADRMADRMAEQLLAPVARVPFGSMADYAEDPDAPPVRGKTVQLLCWPRGELERAQARWPELIEPTPEYHRDLEAGMRQLTERGASRIVLVAGTAQGMADYAERTGGSVAEAATRWGYLQQEVVDGAGRSWPPARNGGCWCGSGAKYKKCCGAPISRG